MKLTAQQKREFDKLMGLDSVYTQQGYQQQNEKHRQYDVVEANRQRGFSSQPRNQSEDRLQKAVEMTLQEVRQRQLDRKAAAPTLPEPAPVQLPKLSDIQSMQQWQTAYGSLDAYNKYAKENGWETATGTQIEEKLRQLNGVGSEQAVQQPEDLTHKPFGDEAEAIAQGRDRVGYLQKKAMEFDGRKKALQEASRLAEENLNQQKSNFDSEANQIEDQESLWFLRLAQDDPIAQTYDSYFDYMEAVRNGTVQQKYLPPDIQEHLDTYTRYVEKSDNLASAEKAYSNIQQELSLSEDLREIYSLSPDDMDAFIKVYDAQATNSGGAGPEWQRMMELFGYDKWWKLTSSYSQYMGLLKEQHRQAQKEKDMQDPVNVVLSNLYAPGLNLVSSIYTPIASIGQMGTNNPVYAEDERYGIKTNTGIYDMQRDIQDTRSGTRNLIEGEDTNAGRKFAGMLYGGISSAVDNAARIGAGVVTGINPLGIMAVGSFSSSYEDAANRGANGLQAILYATASAALEVATEKIPLERLLSGTDADTVGKIIADILVKQPGLEIVGEEASYFGGMIADALIMGGKSENNQKLAAYMMAGYTKEQAQQLLTKDILYGAAQIAAETYISSAAMTGASYIGGAKQNGQTETKAQDDGLNQVLQQAAETPASQTVEAVKQAAQQAQQQTQETQPVMQQSAQIEEPTTPQSQPIPENKIDTNKQQVYDTYGPDVGTHTNGNNSGTAYTAANSPVRFRYAVVPVESLTSSHDTVGNLNKAYPQELQPRDRTRAISVLQVGTMSKNLIPELLAESPTAQNGAPFVRDDGVVIGGNGRVMAISMAYQSGKAGAYKQYLYQHASDFGLDPATFPQNPVLVRIPDGNTDYISLAKDLNAPTNYQYSALETAMQDANGLPSIIQFISDGDLGSRSNADFVKRFVSEIVPDSERADMMNRDGVLSQAGLRRLQNAVFAYAYGDASLVERLSESTDNDIKNITNALLALSRKAASLQSDIESGTVQNLGLRESLISAVDLFLVSKKEGIPIEDKANQTSMFNGGSSEYDGLAVNIAYILADNYRSGAKIQGILGKFFDFNRTYGTEEEISLFSQYQKKTQEDLYDEATRSYLSDGGNGKIGEKRNFADYAEYGALGSQSIAQRPEPSGAAEASAPGRDAALPERPGRNTENAVTKSPLDIAMEATVRGEDVQPVRPVSNGSEDGLENGSVGAAERGFDPFSELQFEYGNIPSGKNPVRPDDMPISTDGENRVSYAARTVKGAAVTPDEFSDLIDREVVNGGLTFIPITNDETVQNAVSYISRVGWDEARIRWEADVRAGRAGADTTAVGALLLNNAANAGDRTTWLNILSDYQLLATNTARGLQAMRILKTLQPEDRLYMIRRSVQQMAEDMHLGFDLQIDENLATAYQNAQTDAEADEILGQIQQSIADQIHPTFMDKFTALRYLNMLGNFKTQVRNLAGNVGMKIAKEAKDKVDATIEWIAWKASGETFERTKVFKVRHDLFQAAKADFANVEHQVQSGGRFDDARANRTEFAQGVQDRRRIFRTAPMEYYRRATNWAMDAGDVIFSRNAYAKALAGYLQAHGVENFTDASNQLMDNARAYAIREAQEATFRDTNTFSDWVSRIGRRRDTPALARTLSEGIMPFRRTPANVLVRAEEYSPLGIINATVTSIRAARAGSEITGADVVNSWSKALTGTGMFLFGMLLRNLGLISLGPDDDEKQAAFDKLKGKQDYSLTIPGLPNITLDWLSPVAIPLFMGGELEDMRKEDGIELKDLEKSMTSLSDPLIQMSMLQGVDDTISGIKFSDNNLGQLVLNSSLSYLTQGLTNTFLGQLERSTEDERMTTYVDENSSLPNWMQREFGKASAKIPGLDFQQIPYINEWGQQEKSIENPLLRVAYNTLSPAYISWETNDPVNAELQRIADSRGTEGIFPKTADKSITIGGEKINLNAQQYMDRATTQGQVAHSILDQAFKSEAYQGLSDDGKAKLVSDVYSYANELGKMKALPDRYTNMSAQWMDELGGSTDGRAVETILKRAQVYDVGAPSDTRYDAAVSAGFTTEQMRNTFSKVSASMSSIDGEKTDYDTYRSVLSATQGEERDKWLEVYGLSDSRLEAMQEARKRGYSDEQCIDAFEVSSLFASAQSATSKAWSDGKELPTDKWEGAYNAYQNAPDKLQRLISSQLSTKFTAYLELRNAGMDTKTFLLEVKKYSDIGAEDGGLNDATRWHKALDDDVSSGLITSTQRNILLQNMRYFVQIPQNADKYEELKKSGLDPDSAEYIMAITEGLLPEYGKKTVTDLQIWESIISSDLAGPEKTSALEGYMDEKQEQKLAYAVSLGFSPSEYVDMYRVYKDTDEYGKGRKEFRIQEFMNELNIDRDLAETLLEIYDGVYGK